ncbi:SRPBCC family protein [Streptomyces sp. NBC_01476]|uniref:SRPBCC family protein n=1 Tax=Streptomyces sp. NBC_01476 TaxID=2903881 RepID=UPI002E37A408|nr:SRPBCC family protein [Streptomyces sp. NBC_01476]
MATDQKDAGTDATPMTLLKQELRQYLGAQMKHLAQKAGNKLTDATGLSSVDEDSGTLPKIGARVLHGESPVKAVAGEKAQDVKEKVTGKVKDMVPGGGSGGGDQSADTKAMTIVETIDVGVPLRFAYDHWTEYDSFSGFTKGVKEAERGDEATSEWTVKVGPSTRKWKATVQEQLPDDRIVWTSEGSQGTTQGAVSFHEIAPTLTRIVLVVVYYPSGVVEKTGNIWRVQGRRIRLDFKNFQRYVTFSEDEPEGWRGEIRDGEIVRTHDEAVAEDEDETDGEDEDETDADEEYEDETEDEDE